MTVREPEFDSRERALLLAGRQYRSSLNRFGIPHAEATDPANQMSNPFEAFVVTDYSEKAYESQKEAFYKQYPGTDKSGHTWGVRRKKR